MNGPQTFPLEDHASLRHSEAGCVSMALHGTQFLVTLGPAPHLDGAWQIVGKVVSGLAAVRELAALPCTDDTCAPLRPVAIGLCGVLGGGGLEGALQVVLEMRAVQRQQQVDKANETPADVRARVCDSVKCVPSGPSFLCPRMNARSRCGLIDVFLEPSGQQVCSPRGVVREPEA